MPFKTKVYMKILVKKNIYLIIFITFYFSCNMTYKRGSKRFLDAKSTFEKEFVEHFPSEIDRDFAWNESHSNKFDNFRLTFFMKASKDSILNLKKAYKKKSKAVYLASDSCLLIVNRFANNDNYGYLIFNDEHYKDINKQCYSDKLPIPNFWHNRYTTDSTDCKLPSDSEIYVIDGKKGEFKEKELLSKKGDMPMEWAHGVSYGVAISESRSIIIYWMVMW